MNRSFIFPSSEPSDLCPSAFLSAVSIPPNTVISTAAEIRAEARPARVARTGVTSAGSYRFIAIVSDLFEGPATQADCSCGHEQVLAVSDLSESVVLSIPAVYPVQSLRCAAIGAYTCSNVAMAAGEGDGDGEPRLNLYSLPNEVPPCFLFFMESWPDLRSPE